MGKLRGLINWAMGEQIRTFKEEVHVNAMKELGLEDEMAYELYKMEQEQVKAWWESLPLIEKANILDYLPNMDYDWDGLNEITHAFIVGVHRKEIKEE